MDILSIGEISTQLAKKVSSWRKDTAVKAGAKNTEKCMDLLKKFDSTKNPTKDETIQLQKELLELYGE